jgi:hypothetical protein
MLAILKRLIAHRNIKIAFHRTEQRQPLPISPNPIKQLLYDFLRSLHTAGDTHGIPTERGIITAKHIFKRLYISLPYFGQC